MKTFRSPRPCHEIRIPPDQRISLQFGAEARRHVCRYVGRTSAGLLLLEPPAAVRSGRRRPLPGNRVTVRFLAEGVIYGFHARIEDFTIRPQQILFLGPPLQAEAYTLRAWPRTATHLPAMACQGSRAISGTIADLGGGGCRFVISDGRIPSRPIIRREEILRLAFTLPDRHPPVSVSGRVLSLLDRDMLKIRFEDEGGSTSARIGRWVNSMRRRTGRAGSDVLP